VEDGAVSWRRTKRVETLDEFLDAMLSTQWNVSVELFWASRFRPITGCIYRTHSHDYSAGTDIINIANADTILPQARDARLIAGRLEWGYTSDTHWKLSAEGERRAYEVRDRPPAHAGLQPVRIPAALRRRHQERS
jgi:hypothetical protein